MKGDVVVVPFPFTDLSRAKRRPALVIATPEGEDVLLCQITSQQVRDSYAISLEDVDFSDGALRVPSNIRPNRIFTADRRIVLYRAGSIKPEKLDQVIAAIVSILKS